MYSNEKKIFLVEKLKKIKSEINVLFMCFNLQPEVKAIAVNE